MAIKIKPSHKGRFKARAKAAGRSVQGEARAVLNDPDASTEAKEQANFARNASRWKKRRG